ncbi:hypothetical protein LXL04_027412 [Taraxacum kok-saghyz]
MGCVKSSNNDNGRRVRRNRISRPAPWAHTEPITRAQLNAMRAEFWNGIPQYGGQREVWEALRAAVDAELHLAHTIIDNAGIILHAHDLTVSFDENGARYDLPLYVLSEPTNLING